MRISDWSPDVCSSDLLAGRRDVQQRTGFRPYGLAAEGCRVDEDGDQHRAEFADAAARPAASPDFPDIRPDRLPYGHRAVRTVADQIGRASCRERVCQYV